MKCVLAISVCFVLLLGGCALAPGYQHLRETPDELKSCKDLAIAIRFLDKEIEKKQGYILRLAESRYSKKPSGSELWPLLERQSRLQSQVDLERLESRRSLLKDYMAHKCWEKESR